MSMIYQEYDMLYGLTATLSVSVSVTITRPPHFQHPPLHQELGLGLLYVGCESGDDTVLQRSRLKAL